MSIFNFSKTNYVIWTGWFFIKHNIKLKFVNALYSIRILSNEAEENGVFIVWGNSQEWTKNDVSRDILSFTYNCDVFHAYLDIQTTQNTDNYSDALGSSTLEIGIDQSYIRNGS